MLFSKSCLSFRTIQKRMFHSNILSTTIYIYFKRSNECNLSYWSKSLYKQFLYYNNLIFVYRSIEIWYFFRKGKWKLGISNIGKSGLNQSDIIKTMQRHNHQIWLHEECKIWSLSSLYYIGQCELCTTKATHIFTTQKKYIFQFSFSFSRFNH